MAAEPNGGVTVVIPVFNGRGLIADCVRSIPDWADVVAVDDGSTDGAPELIEAAFPRVRLIRNDRNLGFGSTCNVGIGAAKGDVVVLLNSDARLRTGALETLRAAFDDPRVGIAGPRLVFPDDTHQTSAGWFPTPRRILAGSFLANDIVSRLLPRMKADWAIGLARRDHATDRDVDWVQGAAIALHKRCLDDISGFDESYYMYVEETDLCWRAAQAGWRIRYVAGAVVEHIGGASTGDPSVQAQRLLDSEARFIRRSMGPAALRRWVLARSLGGAAKVLLLAGPALASPRVRTRLRFQWASMLYAQRAGAARTRGGD